MPGRTVLVSRQAEDSIGDLSASRRFLFRPEVRGLIATVASENGVSGTEYLHGLGPRPTRSGALKAPPVVEEPVQASAANDLARTC